MLKFNSLLFFTLFLLHYNVGQSNPIQVLQGHSDRIYSVCFHPREPVLATCSADMTIKIWSSGRAFWFTQLCNIKGEI